MNKIIEVLKLEIEAKERSLSVSASFVDTQENEFLYEKFVGTVFKSEIYCKK